MKEHLQGRSKLDGILRGLGLAAVLVVINGLVAMNFVPSSYEQFTWEAYAGVVYTPIPDGGTCTVPEQCASGFCVMGVCCDTICDQPGFTCETGICGLPAAPAPAASHTTLLLIVLLLVAVGFFALTPLRSGKRR